MSSFSSITPDHRRALQHILLGLAVGFAIAWFLRGFQSAQLSSSEIASLQQDLQEQVSSVGDMREKVDVKLRHVATKVSDLQARMQRIDALGEHLTYAAGLERGEFDFKAPVPTGGPGNAPFVLDSAGQESLTGVEKTISELDALLSDRFDQLSLLANEIQYVEQQKQNRIAGKPVVAGWLSSHYGYRTDPFTKKRAWHNGVDYAGRQGSEVVAVAGGVVTKSERQSGYGYLVEISHADGYLTRYAHNKENKVALGDVVEKGQVIATMGSTGRSTGPHVHFEVLKNGKSYNPARYLRRASL